jgi:hypothetical protein
VDAIKETVAAVFAFNAADADPSPPPCLAALQPKAVEAAVEKAEVMHRLRMTIACHEENDLLGHFKRVCKMAGPSAHPSKRDTALPVWWTGQSDLTLLRLTAALGLGAWKKIAEESELSRPPATFVRAPPKPSGGADWVTSLSAKVAEKRVAALLQAACSLAMTAALSGPVTAHVSQSSSPDSFVRSKKTITTHAAFRASAPAVPAAFSSSSSSSSTSASSSSSSSSASSSVAVEAAPTAAASTTPPAAAAAAEAPASGPTQQQGLTMTEPPSPKDKDTDDIHVVAATLAPYGEAAPSPGPAVRATHASDAAAEVAGATPAPAAGAPSPGLYVSPPEKDEDEERPAEKVPSSEGPVAERSEAEVPPLKAGPLPSTDAVVDLSEAADDEDPATTDAAPPKTAAKPAAAPAKAPGVSAKRPRPASGSSAAKGTAGKKSKSATATAAASKLPSIMSFFGKKPADGTENAVNQDAAAAAGAGDAGP